MWRSEVREARDELHEQSLACNKPKVQEVGRHASANRGSVGVIRGLYGLPYRDNANEHRNFLNWAQAS